jgi:hypothetical protein
MSRFLPDEWILPAIDERTRAFFTSGKLLLQACAACGAVQHPPEDVCRHCQEMVFETRESSGRGVVFSYTIVHHAVHPILEQAVPYAVALVELDDFPHVRVVANVVDLPPGEVRIGLRVAAVWQDTVDPQSGERLLFLQWQPASSEAASDASVK